MQKKRNLNLTPIRQQVVSPEEFVRLFEEKGNDIASAKILPPKFGDKGFGMILIEWKHPVFVSFAELTDNLFVR